MYDLLTAERDCLPSGLQPWKRIGDDRRHAPSAMMQQQQQLELLKPLGFRRCKSEGVVSWFVVHFNFLEGRTTRRSHFVPECPTWDHGTRLKLTCRLDLRGARDRSSISVPFRVR